MTEERGIINERGAEALWKTAPVGSRKALPKLANSVRTHYEKVGSWS